MSAKKEFKAAVRRVLQMQYSVSAEDIDAAIKKAEQLDKGFGGVLLSVEEVDPKTGAGLGGIYRSRCDIPATATFDPTLMRPEHDGWLDLCNELRSEFRKRVPSARMTLSCR